MTQGDRLRQARTLAGYKSAAKAAAALSMTESAYRSHENGTNGFTVDQAGLYGAAFGVDPAWLMFGDTTAPAIAALVGLLQRKGLITEQEAGKVLRGQ